ncbi:MAG TPA: RNA polymerase sigma factor [Candidatus Polarisedimenticolaceae bacterium]|nr:RNA polymerase sigma factor [Candidatus Polarisedimenticolaceae bacterium]
MHGGSVNVDPGIDAERLRSQLERAVARICPRWLRGERDDLVQSSLVRILEQVRGGGVSFNATYLWRTAYAVVLDEVRRARRKYERPLDDEGVGEAEAPAADPERRALDGELVRAIQACLRGLTADRRRAVQLRLAGLRYAEAAELLGADAKRTANLVFRGFEDLRHCLREKGAA